MIAHRRPRIPALVAACAVFLAAPLRAQPAADATADSVRRAVQAFYSWYVPRARQGGAGSPWMAAVRARPAAFAPAIARALRRDSVASSRSADEVVGLDGDPFLNAQDPCTRYVVRRVVRQGARYLADVVGEGGCARHTRPDVVVEVARVGGAWRLENFRYRDPADDLLSLLRRLHVP